MDESILNDPGNNKWLPQPFREITCFCHFSEISANFYISSLFALDISNNCHCLKHIQAIIFVHIY